MARACRRKDSTFETSQVKSVFLYGKPNKVKLNLLSCMQQKFCELANENIRIICKTDGLLLQLVKNDKKDSTETGETVPSCRFEFCVLPGCIRLCFYPSFQQA